ncbi:MAG: zinc-ribbon domain-containing protein [bacterium]|nr:MAG: zinc-ribbon domain-containing protein [bacterium]
MKITCPQCQTSYQVADEKIPPGGARANCLNCGQEILIASAKGQGPSPPLGGKTSADYGQTMSFDFQEVDQSKSEVSDLIDVASVRVPFLRDGVRYALRDAGSGKIFVIESPQVTIGRSGTDIVLDDPEVSRKHCTVKVFGDHIMLFDSESTNGTFVGDRKVMVSRLDFGDTFTIGNTTIEALRPIESNQPGN